MVIAKARAGAPLGPGADVRVGPAEELPWADASFDTALACLVIRFMRDPDQGVREMANLTGEQRRTIATHSAAVIERYLPPTAVSS